MKIQSSSVLDLRIAPLNLFALSFRTTVSKTASCGGMHEIFDCPVDVTGNSSGDGVLIVMPAGSGAGVSV
jgi:hypothetical protein